MKRNIAIIAGGDSSEHDVSLRSAQGIYSFMDKERYNVYIVEVTGLTWKAHLENDTYSIVDKNDLKNRWKNRRVEFILEK